MTDIDRDQGPHQGGVTRRQVLTRLGAAGAALALSPSVLAACGGDNSSSSSTATTWRSSGGGRHHWVGWGRHDGRRRGVSQPSPTSRRCWGSIRQLRARA